MELYQFLKFFQSSNLNNSILCIPGDESSASCIMLLSACELYLNATYYTDQPIIQDASNKDGIISKDRKTLFGIPLTQRSENDSYLKKMNFKTV